MLLLSFVNYTAEQLCNVKVKMINETVFVSCLVMALKSSAPKAVDVNTAFAFASTAGVGLRRRLVGTIFGDGWSIGCCQSYDPPGHA
jgi:hypothetical protein